MSKNWSKIEFNGVFSTQLILPRSTVDLIDDLSIKTYSHNQLIKSSKNTKLLLIMNISGGSRVVVGLEAKEQTKNKGVVV